MKRLLAIILILISTLSFAAEKTTDKKEPEKEAVWKAETFSGLSLRSIGPALTSGRISDFAIDPKDLSIRYVAAASGGVWKTTNYGTTWTPIFDSQGSYSIGCVVMDPNDPLVIWVGTGENNSQRSVGYGDGVYRSVDGGKNWENVGLKESQHIAKIVIDPSNSKTVYVAAQGPLWSPGGERGLYKTTDSGKTWNQVLKISENTGVTDLVMDPRNPDVLIAAAYQRRRHVWALIDGGPESAIYKSTDAGATWNKMENGLPKEDMGRIGLALSPADPDVVYAIIEAANKAGGFFRSTDSGTNWEKQSEYISASPQYYQEIIADPKNVDRVYSMDTWMMVTDDGGKTFRKVGEKSKHVDNHALWIDPDDTDHLLSGCDGGLYESYDRGATWNFYANLPVTQFYKVALDTAAPFYNVYGGTQDNFTLGGPSQTTTASGIMNSDWFVTVGGDGFQSQVDPEDSDIIYSQSQYGVLLRFDRKTGEKIDIQPQPGKGEPALRYNWDSPLMISPFSHTRLYFAANILFRSDDRGDSWHAVSPDLTRQLDRNKLKVMDKVWSADAVAKNNSTSFYGNIVALAESPVKEGLLFVGTDDGLIQISEDGGANWRKIDRFPGIPDMTYVSRIVPSPSNVNTVFASFNNHKMGDFKPYLLRSTDLGKTWTSISGDLPENGSVWVVVQDTEKADLLFAGTEFGIFFTINGGKNWIQLKGGMPLIAVRDLAIHKKENDLVVATFGRGFYVLDDYTPLRLATEAMLQQEASLLPVKQAWMFIPEVPLGLPGKSFMGDSFYIAPNPPFGAVFTYYLKDELKTKKKQRQEEEKKIAKEGKDVFYPSWQTLEAEAREEAPAILLTVQDEDGNVVRRISGLTVAGFSRVAWDLRYPPADPTQLKPPPDDNPFINLPLGPLAAPGTYKVSLAKRMDGKIIPLGETQSFSAESFGMASIPPQDRTAVLAFQKKTQRLQRAVLGAVETATVAQTALDYIKKAIDDTPAADPKLSEEARTLSLKLKDVQKALSGDPVVQSYSEPVPPSIVDRVQGIVYGLSTTTYGPTGTHQQAYSTAASEFESVLQQLRTSVEVDLKNLESKMELSGAPWTPGRVPQWKKE